MRLSSEIYLPTWDRERYISSIDIRDRDIPSKYFIYCPATVSIRSVIAMSSALYLGSEGGRLTNEVSHVLFDQYKLCLGTCLEHVWRSPY